MSLRDRLRARQLPSQIVTLAAADNGAAEQIQLRALPAADWEALVQLHSPSEQDAARGAAWDVHTFRPALLAASVVTDAGEDPLSEQDWADLIAGHWMTAGEVNTLFNVACTLNDRTPDVSLGKDSTGTPS